MRHWFMRTTGVYELPGFDRELIVRVYGPGHFSSKRYHAQVRVDLAYEIGRYGNNLRWLNLVGVEKDFTSWEEAEEACFNALVRILTAAPGW